MNNQITIDADLVTGRATITLTDPTDRRRSVTFKGSTTSANPDVVRITQRTLAWANALSADVPFVLAAERLRFRVAEAKVPEVECIDGHAPALPAPIVTATVPAPSFLATVGAILHPVADAARDDATDAAAHAAADRPAPPTPKRIACPCTTISSGETQYAFVEVRSPRTGAAIRMWFDQAESVVPGITRRIRTANGKAMFTPAELVALKAKADAIEARKAANAKPAVPVSSLRLPSFVTGRRAAHRLHIIPYVVPA